MSFMVPLRAAFSFIAARYSWVVMWTKGWDSRMMSENVFRVRILVGGRVVAFGLVASIGAAKRLESVRNRASVYFFILIAGYYKPV